MSTTIRFALVAFLLAPLPAGCTRSNAEHCANLSGAATCIARDPNQPFCSICFAPGGENGCTAQEPPDMCLYQPDGASSTAANASTTSDDDTTASADESTSSASTSSTTAGATTTDADTTTGGTTQVATESSDGGLPFCGDGEVDPGESCDGTNLNGTETCQELGLGVGVLTCDERCQYDTSECCEPNGAACAFAADCCSGTCVGALPLVPGECQ